MHVEGDAFFAFLARGAIEPWLPESKEQNEVVTRAAASAAGRYAAGGYLTVYDGVVVDVRHVLVDPAGDAEAVAKIVLAARERGDLRFR